MLHNNADARRCSYFELGLPVLIGNKRVKVPKEHSSSFRERGMFLLTKDIEIATTSGMTRYTSIHDL